jgi:DNA (cytosine-5)-methyltransferase 1
MRILDLFSCAGGAAVGYSRAGFEVVGVDIDPQPNYPYEHHVADALAYLAAHGHEFDAVHASPPCQDYSALKAVHGNEWPRLIEPTRDLLEQIGKPYVIENVQGAPVRRDLTLCGEMFGLGVIRHRYFELGGWTMPAPAHIRHRGRVRGWRHGAYFDGPYLAVHGEGGGKGTVAEWQVAMGIDWTDVRREIAEAIPPIYTQFIGTGLIGRLIEPPATIGA